MGPGGRDVAFLTSVFTHMLPEDVEHYLDELARVLKPGGRTLITWFLLLGAFVAANQWLFALVGACPASVVLGRTPCFRSEVTR